VSLKPDEIRKMTPEERINRLNELRLELMKLAMQAKVGTIDNPGKIRAMKKSIARILTIQTEEEKRKKGEAK